MARFPYYKLGLFSVCLALTAAAAVECAGETRENSLEPGSWSIQFQIDENFQLKSFSGSAGSVKRH